MAATNIRELTFEHVLETILKPAGVKVGGFPEEIFLDLTEKEKEDWLCSIWYVLVIIICTLSLCGNCKAIQIYLKYVDIIIESMCLFLVIV